MRANIIVCLQAEGFMGYSAALDLSGQVPPLGPFSAEDEIPVEGKSEGLDAYKLAVLVSIAAAILSLCL